MPNLSPEMFGCSHACIQTRECTRLHPEAQRLPPSGPASEKRGPPQMKTIRKTDRIGRAGSKQRRLLARTEAPSVRRKMKNRLCRPPNAGQHPLGVLPLNLLSFYENESGKGRNNLQCREYEQRTVNFKAITFCENKKGNLWACLSTSDVVGT